MEGRHRVPPRYATTTKHQAQSCLSEENAGMYPDELIKDIAYVLFKELGIIWLVRRLGLDVKEWIKERERRDE
jgi:hypothetical protein